MPADIEDRVADLERYQHSHEAAIRSYWGTQWRRNTDTESRVRELERFQNRLAGGVVIAAFVGSGIGAAVVSILLSR